MTHHETLTESMFIKVFFALIALTTLTFLQPYFMHQDLSNTIAIQMFIAVIKTFLIDVSFSIDCRFDAKFSAIIIVSDPESFN